MAKPRRYHKFSEREDTVRFLPSSCLTGRKGGELASAVHAYSKTGDPYMRSLVQHILGLVSHPVLNFLYRWIYDGELEDTYHEVSDMRVFTNMMSAFHCSSES